MKVIVLGKDGMLGRYVYTYLKNSFEVIGTTRSTFDAMNVNDETIDFLHIDSGDVVINCIGLIPQRPNIYKLDFLSINSMFPLVLSLICKEAEANLIHVTTDCVFDGKTGGYNELSAQNTADFYGKTKSLGEPEKNTIIRTSIVGEELKNKLSLLEWAKYNAGKETKGYTNHYWNGITCLQFSVLCEKIIKENLFWKGVKHIFSPTMVSKYKLLKMISDEFNLDLKVSEVETSQLCDRTLTTSRDDITFDIPELSIQLKDLHDYTSKLRGI